jgi:microcystin-dependent protein
MAYSSAINQRNLENVLYNVTVELAPTNDQALASEAYVNSEATIVQDSIDTYTEALTTLTNQFNAVYDQYQYLQAISTNIIGSVIFLPQDTAPANYLPCDGFYYDTVTYPELFAVIGYRYGNGGTQFGVPNFVSQFPVGANVASNVTSNLSYGNGFAGATNTYNAYGGIFLPVIDVVPPHTHLITDNGHQHAVTNPDTLPFSNVYGPLLKQSTSGSAGYPTGVSQTGISILSSGFQIQATDRNSNLAGVNVTPPFLALNAYICYQIN